MRCLTGRKPCWIDLLRFLPHLWRSLFCAFAPPFLGFFRFWVYDGLGRLVKGPWKARRTKKSYKKRASSRPEGEGPGYLMPSPEGTPPMDGIPGSPQHSCQGATRQFVHCMPRGNHLTFATGPIMIAW